MSDATYTAWREKQVSKITLDADAARIAMEFGYAARDAYAGLDGSAGHVPGGRM